MKKALLLVLALGMVMTTGIASAQGGAVVLYTDLAFTQCNTTASAGLLNAYVVHELHPGATAVQYSVQNNSGGMAFYLADQNPFTLVIGNSQDGVAISYGGCFNGQVHAQTILYQMLGAPAACTTLEVVPDPAAPSGFIEGVDCATPPLKTFPNASRLTFNNDGTCSCGIIIPVEETNWGRVKSLYSN
jgi:hypothetical protein